jgi:hypothetical protein
MNLTECQQHAIDIDCYNSLRFTATFPSGTFFCQWVDAHFGLISVDGITKGDEFISMRSLKERLGDDFDNVGCIPYKPFDK